MIYQHGDRCDACGTGVDVQRDNETGECLCGRCFLVREKHETSLMDDDGKGE